MGFLNNVPAAALLALATSCMHPVDLETPTQSGVSLKTAETEEQRQVLMQLQGMYAELQHACPDVLTQDIAKTPDVVLQPGYALFVGPHNNQSHVIHKLTLCDNDETTIPIGDMFFASGSPLPEIAPQNTVGTYAVTIEPNGEPRIIFLDPAAIDQCEDFCRIMSAKDVFIERDTDFACELSVVNITFRTSDGNQIERSVITTEYSRQP